MDNKNNIIYDKLPSDRYTPFSLAKKLKAIAILESASFSKGKERYSLIMLEEAFRIIEDEKDLVFIIDNERQNAKTKVNIDNPDILDVLSYVASQNKKNNNNIPLPASGIGYLSYEFCLSCDTINFEKQNDELKIPKAAFIVGHIYIIIDHFSEELHIFGLNYNEHKIDLKERIQDLKERIQDLDFSYLQSPKTSLPYKVITNIEESKTNFINNVNILKTHIVNGDILQAVPSRRLQIESKTSALEVYRKIRLSNPSPYLFYIDFEDFSLVGASPESLVRVRNKEAFIRPIAGTIKRGKNDAEDEKLKIELLNNEKEKAEHLMLVDLARNDLGRVCKTGSVKITRFMECEVFSHVIHLVSDVSGKLREDILSINVLRAAFPAGTVSGAPKIKAIELISKTEKTKRNFYAGGIGYIDIEGGIDFCIAIRCALKQGDTWTLQAGAGIVYDSVPQKEWEETNQKLGSMCDALDIILNKN